jgi:DNA-binding CsgD family transcriptional regulator
LQFRTARPEDLDQCLKLACDRALYDDAHLLDLRAMWLDIISRDVGGSNVVFADDDPGRVLGFSVSTVVDHQWFDDIRTGRARPAGFRLLQQWRAGQPPFLGESALAEANGKGGINVFVTHVGIFDFGDSVRTAAIVSSLAEAFVAQYAASNMRGFVCEAAGVSPKLAAAAGFNVRDRGPEPVIVSLTRTAAREQPGNLTIYQLFLRFQPPRFRFDATERRILRLSLEGESDETIAKLLTVAPRTLKKRWARIYLAMERTIGIHAGGADGHRGAEARRHVLHYLRRHPEELHPYREPQAQRRSAHRALRTYRAGAEGRENLGGYA